MILRKSGTDDIPLYISTLNLIDRPSYGFNLNQIQSKDVQRRKHKEEIAKQLLKLRGEVQLEHERKLEVQKQSILKSEELRLQKELDLLHNQFLENSESTDLIKNQYLVNFTDYFGKKLRGEETKTSFRIANELKSDISSIADRYKAIKREEARSQLKQHLDSDRSDQTEKQMIVSAAGENECLNGNSQVHLYLQNQINDALEKEKTQHQCIKKLIKDYDNISKHNMKENNENQQTMKDAHNLHEISRKNILLAAKISILKHMKQKDPVK